MRGVVTLKILQELEKKANKPITEMFDLICGTSAGAILASIIGIRRQNLDFCENVYRKFAKKVFMTQVICLFLL